MTLTSQENAFLADVSYPFVCFDQFTVTQDTPHRELHLLFHFALSANADLENNSWQHYFGYDQDDLNRTSFASKLQQPGCEWVLIERIYAEGKIIANQCLMNWLTVTLEQLPLLEESELIDFLAKLTELQAKHPLLIEPLQPFIGSSILALPTLSEAIANQVVALVPHLKASQHWAESVTSHRCSYLIALAQEIELHGWQNADRIAALAKAISHDAQSMRGVDSLVHYQAWVDENYQHQAMQSTFKDSASTESYANYHHRIFCYGVGHQAIAKLAGYEHASDDNFAGFGFGEYPLYNNDPLADAESWIEKYFHFHKLDLYGRRKSEYPEDLPTPKDVFADREGMGTQVAQALLRRMRYFQLALDHYPNSFRSGSSVAEPLADTLKLLRKTMIEGLITPDQWVSFVHNTTHEKLYTIIGDQVIRSLPMLAEQSGNPCQLKAKAIEALAETFNLNFGEQNGSPRLKGTFDFETENELGAAFAAHLARFALNVEVPFDQEAIAAICPALINAQEESFTYSVRGMPIYDGPFADELHQLEKQQLLQATAKNHWRYANTGLFEDWLALKPKELISKIELVRACHSWAEERAIPTHGYVQFIASSLRKKLDLSEGAVKYILKHYLETSGGYLMKNITHWVSKNGMPTWLKAQLQQLITEDDNWQHNNWLSDNKKVPQLVTDLIHEYSEDEDETTTFSLAGNSPLIARINAFLTEQNAEALAAWQTLLATAATVTGAKANAKQLKQLQAQVEAIGSRTFSQALQPWLVSPICNDDSWDLEPATLDLIRGLLAATPYAQSPELEQAWFNYGLLDVVPRGNSQGIAGNALTFLQYFESQGNAIIRMLGNSHDLSAIVLLNRLQMKFKLNKTRKLIEKSIEQLASYHGLSRGELEDLATPDHGLALGQKAGQLGQYRYEINLDSGSPVKLAFFNPEGKALKSVPAAIKTQHSEELKTLRAEVKAIQNDLSAQKSRIDREMREPRNWSVSQFKQHYFEHPLMAVIARTLVWTFTSDQTTTSAIYHDGAWRDANGQPSEPISDNCTICLWHPIEASEEETLQWRHYILQQGLVQAIKQVFREIYLLTDAEVATHDHSLRMAAHIVRQHQFVTLARGRGWNAKLMTFWDYESGDPLAYISTPLAHLGMEARLHILEPYDNESNDMGVYTHMITDRVRFVDTNTEQDIAMSAIPPRALSEVLRDCDLFVGVATIGADPNWHPERYTQGYQDYWHSYSFGELQGAATQRKAILETLLPGLAIGERCHIEGRFLHVKGNIREYKIHIGSTNILMSPNDSYLCIVPARKDTNKVMLPFEGDSGFALLLSKAVMLAADDKIKDSTIISQIKPSKEAVTS
ncbi:hypothetical protein A3K86_16820 [Photobacterium jeanii]|uniref:Uncharacterized protein n=1 Tax=Photobacterium jeanii TaxID=858640 RepID=A0A178K8N0_9GAMM|nr:DUF4132 domain-containing protein [Photobacterium jeanii]OAN13315.1 hypothetical protein A3K86_16820 [Photobacterium jeanii]PST90314.1 DUF4132 domain-containing protein [Photobacterium jeanii]